MRYSNETKQKSNGVVYTPIELAEYLAEQMVSHYKSRNTKDEHVKILDPAIGEGELIIALVSVLRNNLKDISIDIIGYETDKNSVDVAYKRINQMFPNINLDIRHADFLSDVDRINTKFDFIIANPPYIRTQILGSNKAQNIAKMTGLTGRVDIYYAFLLYTKRILAENGIAGYITSNKFLTIKSGSSIRNFMISNYKLLGITDFGDTKLFTASVLPCIVIFTNGVTMKEDAVPFISIYEKKNIDVVFKCCETIFDHLNDNGFFKVSDGRVFYISHGILNNPSLNDLWILTSPDKNNWLSKIEENTWLYFSDIGKIRVGIKTTADNVFISDNWNEDKVESELLRPLITHRDAGQIVSSNLSNWKVLYTHQVINGKREAIDIKKFPKSEKYLSTFYNQLASREYIAKANRNWYEIWVPQNPSSWVHKKIVFRDISEKPQFWLDESGSIVNGDCYWIDINPYIQDDVIYLALAVANSHFIEEYYDAKFNTKLYSGKRRFMSQYVEQFPIPSVNKLKAKQVIELVKEIITGNIEIEGTCHKEKINLLINELFLGD